MEDIRRGMESNLYSMNQRRIASIKFLGELYIYRLISSGIIFDTLWTLVTFGHRKPSIVSRIINVFIDCTVAAEGRPLPGQPCPLDMPDDFFRVRLVCVLLDTCGMCFDRGSQQKKLDNFLAFFQLYVHCKNSVPMDVEFMLNDSLEAVRPKLVQFKSFEEAAVAVDEMFNVVFQNAGGESGFKIEAGSPTERGPSVATGDLGDADGDSGEESGGDDDDEEKERGEEDEEEEDQLQPDSPVRIYLGSYSYPQCLTYSFSDRRARAFPRGGAPQVVIHARASGSH